MSTTNDAAPTAPADVFTWGLNDEYFDGDESPTREAALLDALETALDDLDERLIATLTEADAPPFTVYTARVRSARASDFFDAHHFAECLADSAGEAAGEAAGSWTDRLLDKDVVDDLRRTIGEALDAWAKTAGLEPTFHPCDKTEDHVLGPDEIRALLSAAGIDVDARWNQCGEEPDASRRRCDHKFIDSTTCLKCGVSSDALRADLDDAQRFAAEKARAEAVRAQNEAAAVVALGHTIAEGLGLDGEEVGRTIAEGLVESPKKEPVP